MTDWIERGASVAVETVLREWIEREARKEQYPDADPTDWDRERLRRELTDTYGEPAEPVVDGRLDWRAVELTGGELGELGTFPEPAWDHLAGDGTVAGAVTRLDDPVVVDDFPDAAEKIAWFAEHADEEFGAAVAWQQTDEWPPVLLDGNHRACGAHRAAREGEGVTLELHLGYESLP
ncbi:MULTISPECIES: hypothetical protein [Halolamina]|uniref:Uncharacterized protein n=1 Tax=Halolamina pelagica TaxID=699431 RepID=A0A1I5PTS7_9EURY|nr:MULTISPECIES: hypothetical protein [Halolamina]NHX34945.1 hypothetical protein [Halolamina sp. R1-12]SFP37443.1 hypothetical protein SAMN05216277_103101 [Halolamina pelagica]